VQGAQRIRAWGAGSEALSLSATAKDMVVETNLIRNNNEHFKHLTIIKGEIEK